MKNLGRTIIYIDTYNYWGTLMINT